MCSHPHSRQRNNRSNKRRFSDLEQSNALSMASNPTTIKYRAVSINKTFDWELEFLTIKHHYALKKELTSDIALSPLKIHMQLSFNFDNDEDNNDDTNNNNSSSRNNNNNNNNNSSSNSNSNNDSDNKDECDIRLWLVIDHENDRLNKHASFDFGVQYLRRRSNSSHCIDNRASSNMISMNNVSSAQNNNTQSGGNNNDNRSSATNTSAIHRRTTHHHSARTSYHEPTWAELNAKQSHCASGSMWGFQIGKSLNDLKKYCLPKEDKMLFRFDLEFITKCESQMGSTLPSEMEFAEKFMNRIENMWHKQLFVDVTIECPAHIGNCNYCEDYNDMIHSKFDNDDNDRFDCNHNHFHQSNNRRKHKKTLKSKFKKNKKTTKKELETTVSADDGGASQEISKERHDKNNKNMATKSKQRARCKTKPSVNMIINTNHDDDNEEDEEEEEEAEEEEDADMDDDDDDDEDENTQNSKKNTNNNNNHNNNNESDDDSDMNDEEEENKKKRKNSNNKKRTKTMSTKDDDDDICLDEGMIETFEIHAHKSVLSSVSSVFYAMLNSSSFKEQSESHIVINDICYNTMYHLLYYAYSNRVSADCDLTALFAAAEKYQIYELCHLCLDRMSSLIGVDTVCELIVFIQRYHDNHHIDRDIIKKFELSLYEFMVENYPQISKLDSYHKLKSKIESKLTMFMYQKQFGGQK